MRRQRWRLPLSAVVGAAALFLLAATSGSWAGIPASASDYDLRAARALFNTLRPGAVPEATNLPADLPRKLNLWDVAGDKRSYALNFGTRGGDFDDRGYFKIVLNGELSDAASQGWKILSERDPDTGAEVFWKRVERSAASRFGTIGVRRKVGNVILTFVQRRPFDEDPNVAAREARVRFAALLGQAKENKLFARLVILQIGEDGSERELDLATGPLRFSVKPGSEPTAVRLRAEVRDTEDNQMTGIERYDFLIAGPLKDFITITGATPDPAQERWTVKDKDVVDVTLSLDPAEGRLRDKLYEPFTGGGEAGEAAIRLRVGVKFAETRR